MQIETGLVIAVVGTALTGGMSWAAYVTSKLVEHARILAVVSFRLDQATVHAARDGVDPS